MDSSVVFLTEVESDLENHVAHIKTSNTSPPPAPPPPPPPSLATPIYLVDSIIHPPTGAKSAPQVTHPILSLFPSTTQISRPIINNNKFPLVYLSPLYNMKLAGTSRSDLSLAVHIGLEFNIKVKLSNTKEQRNTFEQITTSHEDCNR